MKFSLTYLLGVSLFFLIPALVGGWLARQKGDFYSRGFIISLISSWWGPLFIHLSPQSKAKHGDSEDKDAWPQNGPLANMCFIASCVVVYIIYKWWA
ncbi:MAG: hypothetical protein PVG03_04640 [Desulfarculaceae bacterium]|jgi:hypothetical protein